MRASSLGNGGRDVDESFIRPFHFSIREFTGMSQPSRTQHLLEQLVGQAAPFSADIPEEALQRFESAGGKLGYSQLNELLLLFGFDRITPAFFRFLLDGSTGYMFGDALSLEQLETGVQRFRKTALLPLWERQVRVQESFA